MKTWLVVPCPRCAAGAGAPCITRAGVKTSTHASRQRAARLLLNPPPPAPVKIRPADLRAARVAARVADIRARIQAGQTQAAIGRELGISRQRVHQLLTQSPESL